MLKRIVFTSLFLFISACSNRLVSSTNTPPAELMPILTITPSPLPTALSLPLVSNQPYRPLLMAHYLPWFQAPPTSENWGWHWTMNHFDPTQMDANGRSAIASHYYPATGPYDSGDKDLLEYQVMLMKLSGIDGVIVDWYGTGNYQDYALINTNVGRLFEATRQAGLVFVVCYEDYTIENMVENGYLAADQALVQGQADMRYLQDEFFGDESYLKVSGRPILLVFGNPPYLKLSSDWEKLFSGLKNPPVLITEDEPLSPAAVSSYPWPPMLLSGGEELTQANLDSYLTNFYRRAEAWEYWVASAFPGFHDIYQEAEVGKSYGFLDPKSGETLQYTLEKALRANPDIIQIVSWNDFGEGTAVEPAVEYGTQYLEILQQVKTRRIDPEFGYTSTDLLLPLQIYNLRKLHSGEVQVNIDLDAAVAAILEGKIGIAQKILALYQ